MITAILCAYALSQLVFCIIVLSVLPPRLVTKQGESK